MKKIKIGAYFVFFLKKAGTKNIRLRFDKNGNLILTAPWYCRESQAVDFAQKNIEWIEKQSARMIAPRVFQNGDMISILGQTYQIRHNPDHKQGVLPQQTELVVGGEADFLHRRVITFAKEQLYVYMQQKTIEFASKIDKKPAKIALRDTSSRWGSCSSNGNIHFCWKLVFAPLFVIDYIAAHEVAHLKEMNHGAAFWETVSLLGVEQAEAQIWLRKHGREIQAVQSA